jgi:hypothetical protein
MMRKKLILLLKICFTACICYLGTLESFSSSSVPTLNIRTFVQAQNLNMQTQNSHLLQQEDTYDASRNAFWFCNTPGVDHQLGSGFKLKHDKLSGDDNVKVNLWR